MEVIYGLKNYKKEYFRNPVVAIGTFDGVHKAHVLIINKAVALARQNARTSVIMTFSPHPRQIIEKKERPVLLTSLRHRIQLIKQLKPDVCLVVSFNKRFVNLGARQFLKKIVRNKLQASQVVVGEKFNFGKGQEGNAGLLYRFQGEYNFKATIVKPLKRDNVIISSSRIRSLIEQGKLTVASRLLGRRFSILGTVIHGRKRGHVLGVPTANIDPHQEVVPPEGVYAVRIFLKKRWHRGALYIGRQPTFYKEKRKKVIEVHILNFEKKIYGQNLEIVFMRRIRSDKRFDSVLSLKKQMFRDINRVKKLLRF